MGQHLKMVHGIKDQGERDILLAQKTSFVPDGQTPKQVKPPTPTSREIKNVIQNDDMMDRFSRYTTSIDGNLLEKTTEQNIAQFRVIMEVLEAGDDYGILFDRKKLRDNFLEKYCKEALNGKNKAEIFKFSETFFRICNG